VLPIPKISSPTAFSEFRPISLLPCLSKSFEILMAQQMDDHANAYSLVTPYQSGFRKHHSTTTAILKITEDLRSNLEEGQATIFVLLDFSQAFDTVVYELLTCKLSSEHNYSADSKKLLGSYVSGRWQLVRLGASDSDVGRVTCGVPHGLVLGPKSFSFYINSVSRVIINCAFHIYADDLQLYKSCSVENFQQYIDDVNSDLARVHAWAKSNGLLLNPTKSQVIVVYRGKKEVPTPSLSIGPNSIKVVPKVVNLGFTINEFLSPSDHIATVCQKVYTGYYGLFAHMLREPRLK
jgi:Reverse transcriptase (RNA-dependent DNA polymerase)